MAQSKARKTTDRSDSKDKTNFKVKDKIFYPNHGAGVIVAKKTIEIGDTSQQYFEFSFVNDNLSISTPVKNVERLGIRPIYKASVIKKFISELKKKKSQKPKSLEYNPLARELKELEEKGDIPDFIQIIRYCNYIVNMREKEGRLIPVTITRFIQTAMHSIIGELSLATGKSYEQSIADFEKLSGLKVVPLKH